MTEQTERMEAQVDNAPPENGAERHTEDDTPSVEELVSELDKVRRDTAELLDSLQRSRAEFVNYRRRMEQEQERIRSRATESLVRKLLPVADDFERALRSVPEDIARHPWIEGMRLVERKLWNVLDGEGVTPMESVGQPFDPSRHEAVMVDEEGGSADTVVEEFQRGYLLNGDVLRPAMVKVGAGVDEAVGNGRQASEVGK